MKWLVVGWLAALAVPARGEDSFQRFARRQVHMGMPFDITLYAPDEAAANRGFEAAFGRIAELDAIMSDYQPDSELSRLSAASGSGQALRVSPDLWTVLQTAQELSRQTNGAFDVTVGPLVRLWRRARRNHQLPTPDRLEEARRVVGYELLSLDEEARTVTLAREGMRLDLGGIAVGYAIDEALASLAQEGIESALIDGSGDIVAGAPPPGTNGWRVAISPGLGDAQNRRVIALARQAVTTSGDAEQHVVIDGVRYSHIVDPGTGLGLADPIAVTIVAPTGMAADSLATAVSVLGVDQGMRLVAEHEGVEAQIARLVQGATVTHSTPGLNELLVAPADEPNLPEPNVARPARP